jgi:catechol 2,3-dioxygenase-like lactoylglutathione lyase family enzyme
VHHRWERPAAHRQGDHHEGLRSSLAKLASFVVADNVTTMPLALEQINIVVRDMQRSVAFYRLLGVSIEEPRGEEWAEWARHHVNGTTSNGVRVELDSVAFAKQWHPGLDEAKLGGGVLPMFHVSSREDVDRVHARVTAAGHRTHKLPEDAFWGARYAIVEDPDGNSVGIMSAIDESKRRPPPPPPRG